MRVLLLNQFYPPDTAATGQLLADLAAGLAARGHDVHVVASARAYGGGALPPDATPAAGAPTVHRVGATGFGRRHLAGRLLDYASFYALALGAALRLGRADVCVALTTPPLIGLVGLTLGAVRGTRTVLWTMDLYPEVPIAYGVLAPGGLAARALAALARFGYARAAAIVSLGEFMTERLIAAGAPAERIRTVHNWVPGEAVRPLPPGASPLRDEWGLAGHTVVLYSGNLGLGHELDTAVRAVARLGRRDDLRLLFVGHGRLRGTLERLAAEIAPGRVAFRPPVPLARLADALGAGDVHLVSQKPGTAGLIVPSKIYGVLAAGRPVVFLGPEDCEPAAIVREAGCGRIVPPGDEAGLTAAIDGLAADPALREALGRNARTCYEARFGRERSVARIVATIEEIGRGA